MGIEMIRFKSNEVAMIQVFPIDSHSRGSVRVYNTERRLLPT